MTRIYSMVAAISIFFSCLAGPAVCSDTVIDGSFSTGTFGGGSAAYLKHWETQGVNWGPWKWEKYDTNGDGSLNYCFSFQPNPDAECTLYQELYLIDGEMYEIGLDLAIKNC